MSSDLFRAIFVQFCRKLVKLQASRTHMHELGFFFFLLVYFFFACCFFFFFGHYNFANTWSGSFIIRQMIPEGSSQTIHLSLTKDEQTH